MSSESTWVQEEVDGDGGAARPEESRRMGPPPPQLEPYTHVYTESRRPDSGQLSRPGGAGPEPVQTRPYGDEIPIDRVVINAAGDGGEGLPVNQGTVQARSLRVGKWPESKSFQKLNPSHCCS